MEIRKDRVRWQWMDTLRTVTVSESSVLYRVEIGLVAQT